MKRYRFKQSYESYEGRIPEGSEITIMDNGAVYFNGGLVHQAYQDLLRSYVEDKKFSNDYLVEEAIPYNKV